MGKADNKGVVWLLPEETIYLVERGNMQCWWEDGIPMTLQAVYTACLEAAGGLDSYQVYAYLKRCGYIIYRSLGSNGQEVPEQSLRFSYDDIVKPALQQIYNLSSPFFALFALKDRPYGPLLPPGAYKSYQEIYKKITIKENKKLPSSSSSMTSESLSPHPSIPVLDIYKPKPQFKKSNPGTPDFRIIVISARDTTIPSLTDLDKILSAAGCHVSAQQIDGKKTPIQKLKQGKSSIILAIVDSGVISFVRFTDLEFAKHPLYAAKPNQGAKNQGRGPAKGGEGSK